MNGQAATDTPRMEMGMTATSNCSGQALFRAISNNGAEWVFFVRSDGTWAITRDGNKCAAGPGTPASLNTVVQRFLALLAASIEPVRQPLDTDPAARSA